MWMLPGFPRSAPAAHGARDAGRNADTAAVALRSRPTRRHRLVATSQRVVCWPRARASRLRVRQDIVQPALFLTLSRFWGSRLARVPPLSCRRRDRFRPEAFRGRGCFCPPNFRGPSREPLTPDERLIQTVIPDSDPEKPLPNLRQINRELTPGPGTAGPELRGHRPPWADREAGRRRVPVPVGASRVGGGASPRSAPRPVRPLAGAQGPHDRDDGDGTPLARGAGGVAPDAAPPPPGEFGPART